MYKKELMHIKEILNIEIIQLIFYNKQEDMNLKKNNDEVITEFD